MTFAQPAEASTPTCAKEELNQRLQEKEEIVLDSLKNETLF